RGRKSGMLAAVFVLQGGQVPLEDRHCISVACLAGIKGGQAGDADRHEGVVRRQLPAVIDTPRRCGQRIGYVDETVVLPGYGGPIRQVAFDGLGRDRPTLLLSNNTEETARNLLIRYAGRNGVEDGLGNCVNFFHLDCLASEVRLNVDLDCALTAVAQGCYRWLGKQLKGFEKAAAKQLFRWFVETAGLVEVRGDGRV